MVTAYQYPEFGLAKRTKDFILKERTKKEFTSNKEFVKSRVDVFFKEKQDQQRDINFNNKFEKLLNKIKNHGTANTLNDKANTNTL
jgi:hypothetical protein